MRGSQARPERTIEATGGQPGVVSITPLINDLTCKDVYKCRRARQTLVDMGDPAVPYLVDALKSRKVWVRWEAAKALGQIAGPMATNALVDALGNGMFDVRWLAAEALILRGRDALVPLMRALVEKSDLAWFREGAHHVLVDLSHGSLRQTVLPVLQALEGIEPSVEVPLKARALLATISK